MMRSSWGHCKKKVVQVLLAPSGLETKAGAARCGDGGDDGWYVVLHVPIALGVKATVTQMGVSQNHRPS